MKISTEKPPIYDRAEAAFGPGLWDSGVIMTYGDTVHCKKGGFSLDLHEHEGTHIRQQSTYPGGATAWWDRYLIDKDFRLLQETAAYQAQVRYIRSTTRNRVKQMDKIIHIAKSMSEMYADMISYEDALSLFI